MENVYKENIKKIEELMNNGKFNNVSIKEAVRAIRAIYIDPDSCDDMLYEKMKLKYSEFMFEVNRTNKQYYLIKDYPRFSIDCVCGWKAILGLRMSGLNRENVTNDDIKCLLQEYKKIRNNLTAHFIWPCQYNSINTDRYREFRDRIDYTLYDIKKYFEFINENKSYTKREIEDNFFDSDIKLKRAYSNYATEKWLNKFIDFKDFIDKMKLGIFVNEDYDVINIENNTIINEYPTCKKDDLFNLNYYENLKKILERNEVKIYEDK